MTQVGGIRRAGAAFRRASVAEANSGFAAAGSDAQQAQAGHQHAVGGRLRYGGNVQHQARIGGEAHACPVDLGDIAAHRHIAQAEAAQGRAGDRIGAREILGQVGHFEAVKSGAVPGRVEGEVVGNDLGVGDMQLEVAGERVIGACAGDNGRAHVGIDGAAVREVIRGVDGIAQRAGRRGAGGDEGQRCSGGELTRKSEEFHCHP